MSFSHLHVYSAYSLLTSTAPVERLVRDAKAKGFTALALTDRNVMYGAVAFYNECLKNSIKPILGLTVDILSESEGEESYPLVLLAQNNTGFQNLMKISSAVMTKSPKGLPMKWLKHYAKGLIAITAGMEGEVEQLLLQGKTDEARKAANLYLQLFGPNNFYLALQDHGLELEAGLNRHVVQIGEKLGIHTVPTNQVFYLNREDSFAHECLLAVKNGDKMQDEGRERLENDQYYLKGPAEMVELFSSNPDALENTLLIAERCNVTLDLETQHLPKYPSENGMSSEDLLDSLCMSGLESRYETPLAEHRDRLQYELTIIKRMKFSDYFLIVWDFMKYARDNGILTGPGRGSAAGSIVAYVLYITDVDPIKHELFFERFLNPERISMPDIDIDFPDHRREEVIEYVAEKYGEQHVAQIVTFGTMAAKAAARDVGRAFGLNTKELDRLSRTIPSRLGITLEEAYRESEALRAFIKESELNRRLYETALKLEGLPRHTSTHAAGVVISEQPLVHVVPVQAGQEKVYLTQYSMEHLEQVGLLKMDFLGLRNLSLIEAILERIYRNTGKRVNIHQVPEEDSKTFELLGKGDTTGIFQLESEGMRKVLIKLSPSRFEDIVAVNALYRPGPMENIPLFIDRKHGRQEVEYPHQDLKEILENTYGVIVYQEQIMQIAATMAGFSLGEADLLRRAVGKKKKEVLDQERSHFVGGALNKGYSEKTANEIYDLIVRFANYGFNRSHAVAYSMIAYQLAYLKAHFPLHFMAELLTSSMGSDQKIAQHARELQQMNISLLPPSINKSHFSFQPEKEGIRYSLAAIKGVGMNVLKEIFRVRRQKRFKDLFDFCIRVSPKAVNRKALEALVYSGSFDDFGEDRAILLATLDVALEHAELVVPDNSGQFDLFEAEEFSLKPKYVNVDLMRIEDKLSFEKTVLGLYLSEHPVSVYKQYFDILGIKPIAAGRIQKGKVAAYITMLKTIRTKKGDTMAFLTISDKSGELEAVVFPAVYKKFSSVLKQGEVVVLEGKYEERDDKTQFIIQSANPIMEAIKHSNEGTQPLLYIRIVIGWQGELNRLKELLQQHSGSTSVILYYEGTDKKVLLPDQFKVDPTSACLEELYKFMGQRNVILKN